MAKSPRRPILSPSLKDLGKQLDAITSIIVRMRDKRKTGGICLVCIAKKRLGWIADRPANPIMLSYHVISRGHRRIRWDLENQVGACAACNQWESLSRRQAPEQVRAVHVELLGPLRLAELEERSRQDFEWDRASAVELLARYEAMLAEGYYDEVGQ